MNEGQTFALILWLVGIGAGVVVVSLLAEVGLLLHSVRKLSRGVEEDVPRRQHILTVMDPHMNEWVCHSNSLRETFAEERTTLGRMTAALLDELAAMYGYRPYSECECFTGRHFALPNLANIRLSKAPKNLQAVCSTEWSALTPIIPGHERISMANIGALRFLPCLKDTGFLGVLL